jgi:hypothetical protein
MNFRGRLDGRIDLDYRSHTGRLRHGAGMRYIVSMWVRHVLAGAVFTKVGVLDALSCDIKAGLLDENTETPLETLIRDVIHVACTRSRQPIQSASSGQTIQSQRAVDRQCSLQATDTL